MTEQSAEQQGLVEKEVEVKLSRRRVESGVTFVPDTSPPKVDRVPHRSYLSGYLYAGDIILQIDKKIISTPAEFHSILSVRTNGPRTVKIRLLRDEFYHINVRQVESPRPNEMVVKDVEIRWRSGGMPLGVIMRNEILPGMNRSDKESKRIVVSEVEAGSIAKGYFRYDDVITHINTKPVYEVIAARDAILEAINHDNAVTVRIVRSLRVAPSASIPEDVRAILRRHRGFHRYRHTFGPAMALGKKDAKSSPHSSYTTQQGTTRTERGASRSPLRSTGGHVYVQEPSHVDVRSIPMDNSLQPLTKTPPRAGSIPRNGGGQN